MSNAEPRFGRLITAMVTPFNDERELDLDRAQALATRLIEGGNDSLIINGTTGESPTVFYPQKIELFRAVVEAVGGKASVIANVGDNCTADTVNFAKDVAKLGVDGFMCVVPYYNKPPQEGMYQHLKTIANAVELPIILYNIPGRCVVNMEAETTLRLANDCENVIAVKEASGKMDQIATIAAAAPEGFSVYSGDDSATYDIMRLGGAGVISTTGNVAPERMKELVTKCAEGKCASTSYERPVRDLEPHSREGSPQTCRLPRRRRAPAAYRRHRRAIGTPRIDHARGRRPLIDQRERPQVDCACGRSRTVIKEIYGKGKTYRISFSAARQQCRGEGKENQDIQACEARA